ncbi:hypothetical protein J7E68_08770 [Microbacterium sp. ISL-103]|uniref:hypothetical protein n=1 Tax=Microbacterium sp. ISL-103 TaxID=2819156 RepID=UPI001BE5C92B|nr:hypothetical protein [Microbacterium sp. ISL-103]MBT2474663.1 hypothetical protein [Microbacterium sp. ISL-103]
MPDTSTTTAPNSLEAVYAQAKGTMAAFIDESYRTPAQAIGGNSFYVLTAVLFPLAKLDDIRKSLRTIVGPGRWHTTDEAQSEAGQARIIKMAAAVARAGAVVVAIQNPIPTADKNAEAARGRCFEVLLTQLCKSDSLHAQGLVVFERRRDTSQQKSDNQVINALRRSGKIPETLYVTPATPGDEPLLWAPDVASWAVRRHHTHEEDRFVQPFNDKGCLHKLQASS